MRVDPEVRRFLESLPILAVGQGDDLVVETEIHIPSPVMARVWVSRTAAADGAPCAVEIELLNWDGWRTYPPGRNARRMLALALRASGYKGGGLE